MVEILEVIPLLADTGYIAGTGDGIVTVLGKPAKRGVFLLNSVTMQVEQVISSLHNGHYLFTGLDPDGEYIVIARDFKKEFEPFAWDYVKPATDKTIAGQVALWESWQI